MPSKTPATRPMTNAEIARQLTTIAQLLASKGENPFKVRAYRRAADTIGQLPESVDRQVRTGADLTQHAGIGKGIAAAVGEIVLTGRLGQLDLLLSDAPPEAAVLRDYPRLDSRRVARVFKRFNISTVDELADQLERGEIGRAFGAAMEQHFRRALHPDEEILLDDADTIAPGIARYLIAGCGASRAEATGAFRRRVETLAELSFLVATEDFAGLTERLQRYGGGLERLPSNDARHRARFRLPAGIALQIDLARSEKWGVALIATTGSHAHLEKLQQHGGDLAKLAASRTPFPDEATVYRTLKLEPIPPELREGYDEVDLAAKGKLPALVKIADIHGDLHAHTTSSDGAHSIEEMATAAAAKGYEYLGITDHSQSLKIARGVTEENLWDQIRLIDRLNARLHKIRLLKSAEVDILADGSLDYSDALLDELDYTICSIHSRFRLGKEEQTARLLRAMDHRRFNILGHATGRLLLKRPGYEIDTARIIDHARAVGCFFEINASPDRLDLSAEDARRAARAGVKLAINTDAHHGRELDFMRCGIDVARRAGLDRAAVLNCLSWPQLRRQLRR